MGLILVSCFGDCDNMSLSLKYSSLGIAAIAIGSEYLAAIAIHMVNTYLDIWEGHASASLCFTSPVCFLLNLG
ncbi:hypothetical protein BS17DRAFT_792025 [Gyrodon lividus]|nr:hypothetical protein BS17DRAFT_792025 [Gyrodon lividus]